MRSIETLASMCLYLVRSRRSLCMPRARTKMLREYPSMDKQNEALWALIAVIAMTVLMEVWSLWV